MNSKDFKQCKIFHGHVCPGLSVGYKAAKAGMAWLKENRSMDEEIVALIRKMMAGEMNEVERKRFQELHFQKSCMILETPEDELFTIQAADMQLPGKARIEASLACVRCGEPVMQSKLENIEGQMICRGCAG